MNNLFVYGTLKRDFCNHYYLQGAKFLGEASIEAAMYCIRPIPFVTPSDGTKVSGELWQVTDKQLENIDRLEGHPRWYKRREVTAKLLDDHDAVSREVISWVYMVDTPPEGAILVEGGYFA